VNAVNSLSEPTRQQNKQVGYQLSISRGRDTRRVLCTDVVPQFPHIFSTIFKSPLDGTTTDVQLGSWVSSGGHELVVFETSGIYFADTLPLLDICSWFRIATRIFYFGFDFLLEAMINIIAHDGRR